MKNIAIIPARSGSKGLKDKNIKMLEGKPLLWYTIQAAKESGCFDEIMVSTDSEQYADVARKCGASVPFLRSIARSGDTAGSWDVVKEVLENYLTEGKVFNSVCLLQPTSPLRKAKDIIGAYDLLAEKNADSVTSVCAMDHSPLWAMVLHDDLALKEFRNNLKSVPRQQLPQYYRLNGAIYIRMIQYHKVGINLLEDKEFAFVMTRECSVDIDDILDFKYAELLIENEQMFTGGGTLYKINSCASLRRCA